MPAAKLYTLLALASAVTLTSAQRPWWDPWYWPQKSFDHSSVSTSTTPRHPHHTSPSDHRSTKSTSFATSVKSSSASSTSSSESKYTVGSTVSTSASSYSRSHSTSVPSSTKASTSSSSLTPLSSSSSVKSSSSSSSVELSSSSSSAKSSSSSSSAKSSSSSLSKTSLSSSASKTSLSSSSSKTSLSSSASKTSLSSSSSQTSLSSSASKTSLSSSSSQTSLSSSSSQTSLSSSSSKTSLSSSSSNIVSSTTSSAASSATSGLNYYAKAAGKLYFGTAEDFLTTTELSDTAYMTILNNTKEFGEQTPGNYMKYEFTEPEQGVFNYTGGDITLNLAKANNQLVRCHNLVWYNELPGWLTSGTWDNATLISIMQNHITNLIEHWGNRCYAWDVVNEPLNDDGTFMSNIWYNTIGEVYVPLAFKFAAAAVNSTGQDIKLYINEYNIEFPGTKATAMVNLVKTIQAYPGARIDGVGHESHFIVGETPSRASQVQAKQLFTALGLDVAITELDVRFTSLPSTAAGLAQQTTDYVNSVGSCLDVPGCVGITIWDFDDKYSWIPQTFAGQGDADLWNATLVQQPAYFGVAALLANASGLA